MASGVQHLLSCGCRLAEGPLWFEGRLYWFDILAQTLHACDAAGGACRHWTFGEPFSAAAAAGPGTLLLASASALWRFEPETGALARLAPLEADDPSTRSNDGRADRQGGFWIGTMARDAAAGRGAIYRYYRGRIERLLDGVSIPNAICFAPDGRFAYFADSPTSRIRRWALDPEGWPVGAPEPFITVPPDQGVPDGAVVDAVGGIWNARWGGGRIVRHHPDGSVDREVALPVSQPTCPAFGGDGLATLFVTTAHDGPNPAQPHAGDLFALQPPWPGLPDGHVGL